MNGKEYEVKLELSKTEGERIYCLIKDKLNGKQEFQKDLYYCPNNEDVREFMKKKCIRIRIKDNKKTLDYKEIIDENNEYIQKMKEYSTEIGNVNDMEIILKEVGLNSILEVYKERIECIYKKNYKIAIDNVQKLGWFVEIELLDVDIDENIVKETMQKIIKDDLNIKTVNINKTGYSNMLLNLQYGERNEL